MGTVTNLKQHSLSQLVDQLGELRAQIKLLMQEEDRIEETLENTGKREIEGEKYRVAITRSSRAKTNWKKIAIDLRASNQRIAANTKSSPYTQIRCSAKRKRR